MALRSVAERTPSPSDAIREEMLEMRDLLKFEFFFPEKTEFLADMSAEIAAQAPGWQQLVEAAGTNSVLSMLGPPMAHWVVLPILDGYAVVADELTGLRGLFEEKGFLRRCLARARRYRRDGKLKGESVNEALFRSALALARNRGLLEDDDPEAEGRRAVFAAEVAEARDLAGH
jgi:glycerol-3-phosphate O-acyltransferase